MSAVPTETTTIVDGYVIDIETGEVLGHSKVDGDFVVDTKEKAEWVLKRFARVDANLAALDTTPELLEAKALIANSESIRQEFLRRRDWLTKRFEAELGEFARRELEGSKTKTWKSIFGQIALRLVPGRLKVKDGEKALLWARSNATNAIKTSEEFQISKLTDEQRAKVSLFLRNEALKLDELAFDAFEVTPDSETVTIKTGVAA